MAMTNAERQKAYRERKKRRKYTNSEAVAARPRDEKGKILPLPAEEFDRWLDVIAQGYSMRKAAAAVGHSRRSLDKWRQISPENEARYQEAFESGTQAMEDEAVRRGLDGYEEVTRDKNGEIIRTVERYDSALMQMALKARRPEVYRDNYNPGGSQATVIIVESSFRARRERPIEIEAAEVQGLPGPKEE